MIEYIFVLFFIFSFTFFVYIKLAFPFWNNQPVYHTYDFWRWFYTAPYIVYKYRPIKTKFCDFVQIKTIPWSKEDIGAQYVTDLLQCYYFETERILHTIRIGDLDAIFTGQNETSFISLFFENHFVSPSDTGTKEIYPIACITSRSAMLYIGDISMPIYFIDFLCINHSKSFEKDKKKIQRKLLQTHEYNQRIQNPSIVVTLIKKEINLFDGVIPLVSYNTNVFFLRNIVVPSLPERFEIIEITDLNRDILVDFLYIKNIHTNLALDFMLISDIGNILSLINQKLLYIYCLRNKKHVFGMYFIKDPKMQYDDLEGNTIHLAASISNTRSVELFYLGFLHSLQQILRKYPEYKILMIENVGHNQLIHSKWRLSNTPIFENPTAYYCFNYIVPGSPISAERCFFLI